jgi:hypothetical protein
MQATVGLAFGMLAVWLGGLWVHTPQPTWGQFVTCLIVWLALDVVIYAVKGVRQLRRAARAESNVDYPPLEEIIYDGMDEA